MPEDPRRGEDGRSGAPSDGDEDLPQSGNENRQEPPSPAPVDVSETDASAGTGLGSSTEPERDAVVGGPPPLGTPFAAMPSLTEQERDVLEGLWFTSIDELVAACATPEGRASVEETLGLDGEAFQALLDEARSVLGKARFVALMEPAPEHPFGYRLDEPDSASAVDTAQTDGGEVSAVEAGEVGDGEIEAVDPGSCAEDGR
jgi:hypothetical protein